MFSSMKLICIVLFTLRIGAQISNVKEAHELTEGEKHVLVREHLRARRDAKPAPSDMLFMTWDNTLAEESEQISRQCIYEHSQLKSDKYPFVGENIFLASGMTADESLMEGAVQMWESEKENFDFDSNSCASSAVCGHYTQVVWAKSNKVGCGLTVCQEIDVGSKKFTDASLMFCRYAPAGNVIGRAPYETGEPCFDCDVDEQCILNSCANQERDGNADYAEWLKIVGESAPDKTGDSSSCRPSLEFFNLLSFAVLLFFYNGL
uniref:GLIPR1-like protein 1 n=1 Tax=Styela clava TaxID=7725 RepID=UPI001939D8BD|nr:GLIPR1-like protein 1 [Styela clava]